MTAPELDIDPWQVREPAVDTDPDRFFIPLATPEIWLRQGDTRIFSCAQANESCVVPSA